MGSTGYIRATTTSRCPNHVMEGHHPQHVFSHSTSKPWYIPYWWTFYVKSKDVGNQLTLCEHFIWSPRTLATSWRVYMNILQQILVVPVYQELSFDNICHFGTCMMTNRRCLWTFCNLLVVSPHSLLVQVVRWMLLLRNDTSVREDASFVGNNGWCSECCGEAGSEGEECFVVSCRRYEGHEQ